ncbi:MAG TPA: type II secretion system protein GspE, partial [Verrucomicrobiae bacterium]
MTDLSVAASKFSATPDALRALPADFVKRHRVLPLKIEDGILHLATAEPGNARVVDDIRLLTGLEV